MQWRVGNLGFTSQGKVLFHDSDKTDQSLPNLEKSL